MPMRSMAVAAAEWVAVPIVERLNRGALPAWGSAPLPQPMTPATVSGVDVDAERFGWDLDERTGPAVWSRAVRGEMATVLSLRFLTRAEIERLRQIDPSGPGGRAVFAVVWQAATVSDAVWGHLATGCLPTSCGQGRRADPHGCPWRSRLIELLRWFHDEVHAVLGSGRESGQSGAESVEPAGSTREDMPLRKVRR